MFLNPICIHRTKGEDLYTSKLTLYQPDILGSSLAALEPEDGGSGLTNMRAGNQVGNGKKLRKIVSMVKSNLFFTLEFCPIEIIIITRRRRRRRKTGKKGKNKTKENGKNIPN